MPWKEIGALFLALVVILVFGNLWFHLVESILRRLKKRFTRHKEPPVWHTLPPEEQGGADGEPRGPAGPRQK